MRMKLFSICVVVTNTIIFANAKRINERKDQRIVGGDPAPAGRFPYYAHYADRACGATLIHDDILITSATCCGYSQCGVYMDSVDVGEGTYATINEYLVHPEYNSVTTNNNDIMILKLSDAPSGITPIGYNTDNAYPTNTQELTTIGYGTTSQGGSSSNELLQVTVNQVPYNECASYYGSSLVHNTMLCAGADGRDSCQGDSGGPIFDAADGTGEMVGIVSWGYGCAQEEPGVYTRISNYAVWIKDAICCMSDNPPVGCMCPADFGSAQSCSPGSFAGCDGGRDTGSVGGLGSLCLSPDATALVETKGKVSIKDVAVGDKVMTASGEYKSVFTISHSHPDEPTTFLSVQTDMDGESPLELTPLHMLFLQGKQDPIPAKDVKIGDFVQTLQGPQKVTSVTSVTRNGFYNPVTTDGTILVDGIITSTYTSLNGGSNLEIAGVKLVSFQTLFDLTISPYRALCSVVSPDICNQLGGKSNDNRPSAVQFMLKFHEFWLQQNVTTQVVVFLAYVLFFGLIHILLLSSPAGIIVTMGCYCFVARYRRRQARKKNYL